MRLYHALIGAATLVGCATTPNARRDRPVTSSFDITSAQIDALSDEGTLLDAVRRLRPDYLLPRGQSVAEPYGRVPSLYVNGAPHGNVGVLATMPARLAARVTYLRPPQSKSLYGAEHTGGIVFVTTRR